MDKKDPAILFYIDTWLSATAEMDSDVRGWYLNLILHQFDKKSLPNDIEKLALLAGVKFSEFERFKQMLEQVLMQKFKLNDENRLENSYAKTVLQSREQFKDKRSKSGNIGVVIKIALELGFTKDELNTLKKDLYSSDLDKIEIYKNKQVLEQVLEQMRKLYINENGNGNIDIIKSKTFDMAYYKSLGYDWGLSATVYAELDKFLAYRISSHKDAIRTPDTLEAIIRRLRETAKTESDALYIIRNTIEKQAKNLIFELQKPVSNFQTKEVTKKYKPL